MENGSGGELAQCLVAMRDRANLGRDFPELLLELPDDTWGQDPEAAVLGELLQCEVVVWTANRWGGGGFVFARSRETLIAIGVVDEAAPRFGLELALLNPDANTHYDSLVPSLGPVHPDLAGRQASQKPKRQTRGQLSTGIDIAAAQVRCVEELKQKAVGEKAKAALENCLLELRRAGANKANAQAQPAEAGVNTKSKAQAGKAKAAARAKAAAEAKTKALGTSVARTAIPSPSGPS